MNISALDNLNQAAASGKTPSPEVLRKTAEQFEAILLMQLTSALNNTGEADEDQLFGGDGGTDLAKKMFSEQLATSMAQSGGIGLADMIMQQFGANPARPTPGKLNNLSGAMAAIKDIKENVESKNSRRENDSAPLINKAAKFTPLDNQVFSGNPDEFAVVSTYADEIAADKSGDNYQPLTLDGKILNSTRPRVVPEYAIAENKAVSAENNALSATDAVISPAKISGRVEFQMPVAGRISSNFGTRFHPVDRKMKFHGGMDIAVPKNTPVGAAADGVVSFAGWKGGYGNVVIVEHADGTETRYGHNEKLLVREGEAVSAGQLISLSGSTGKSTGPHLHFEVRENGRAVDPRNYLSNVLPKNADRRE